MWAYHENPSSSLSSKANSKYKRIWKTQALGNDATINSWNGSRHWYRIWCIDNGDTINSRALIMVPQLMHEIDHVIGIVFGTSIMVLQLMHVLW